jgi:Fe-S cluster assembly protein SufB
MIHPSARVFSSIRVAAAQVPRFRWLQPLQCDSMLMGDRCGAHTFPYIEVKNPTATVEHEASTSKIGEDQIFYCNQRGIPTEDAVNMIVSGFCKDVFRELPMEFAVEAQKLLGVSLEGSVG